MRFMRRCLNHSKPEIPAEDSAVRNYQFANCVVQIFVLLVCNAPIMQTTASIPGKTGPNGSRLFFGFLLLFSGLTGLGALLWFLGLPILRVYGWESVPCRVLRAEVVNKGYGLHGRLEAGGDLELEWEYRGKRYNGGKLKSDAGFNTPETFNSLGEFFHRLRKSGSPVCYVNPDNPSEAVVDRPDLFPVLLFTGFGAAVTVTGILLLRSGFRRTPGKPLSPRGQCLAGLAFVACILTAALTIVWFGILKGPNWNGIVPRMKEVPCVVASSSVQRGGSSRTETLWRADVLFRYEWDGRTWLSDWYDFRKHGPEREYEEAKALIKEYPRDGAFTCWVDPEQPWIAVLRKEGPTANWLWFVVILLLAIALPFFFAALRKLRRITQEGGLPPA